MDTKDGAAIETQDSRVYIEDLESWPSEMLGKRIRSKGELVNKPLNPNQSKARSTVLQGMEVTSKVLEDATIEIIE